MLRPGVGGHAVGPTAQPAGFGGGGTTGGVLDMQNKDKVSYNTSEG